MSDKPSYRDEIAAEIIARIEAGTAPWQKPWTAGVVGAAPFNPVSGKPYRGINDVWLTFQGRADPRWMTYRQAAEAGAQVRKGERSTTIEYWQWSTRQTLTDANGQPVPGEDGKPKSVELRLDRPRVFLAKVFNAEQIDGLAPWEPPPAGFDPIARAEALIDGAGIRVHHDQANRAFYSPARDSIHLPARGAFSDAGAYYATLLHEVGHGTGHPSRLGREFGPYGSDLYAKEELRAEIASFMLARDFGLPHDPGQHASYVESWLKVLRDDKHEIFRAARDAETIKVWVTEPERRLELEQATKPRAAIAPETEPAMPDIPAKRTYVTVPFAEKGQAKALGAKWDRTAKSWYLPDGLDPAAFSRWAAVAPTPAAGPSPAEEFAEVCKAHGLVLKGAPQMDGAWHRVPVEGDKTGQISGSYRGFLDGRPSGQITNYKAGGTVKWVATGQPLDAEARARIQAAADQVRAQRIEAREKTARKAAGTARAVWAGLSPPETPDASPYLVAKGVGAHGVRIDAEGKLMIPARDADGKLRTLQMVGADSKRFLKDSAKLGAFHVVEPSGAGTLASIANDRDPLLIAEGYATAASIFQATGRPVVVAFDSGNLMPVAEAIRARLPGRDIAIVADDDHANRNGNVGRLKAEQAVGGIVIVPRFSKEEKEQGLTDFNDFSAARGEKALRQAIEAGLALARAPQRGLG